VLQIHRLLQPCWSGNGIPIGKGVLVLRVTSLQKKIIAEGRRILGTTLEVDLPKVVIQEFRSVVSAVRVLLDLRQVNRKWKVGSNKHRFAPTGLFFVCLGGFHTNPFRGQHGYTGLTHC
jgi:hypothetical protein